MSASTTHRFSVQDYYRMAENGVLRSDARVELIDGQITDMSPIGPSHGRATKILNQLFSTSGRGRWITSVQDPVRLDDFSEPQPDLMLLKPSDDCYGSRHPQPDEVFLLVEVSDTSLDRDREEKIPTYARAGIPEVWIVNLTDQTLEVYGQPNFTGYDKQVVLRTGDTAAPLAFPDVILNVAELF